MPISKDNDSWIEQVVHSCDAVLIAWGSIRAMARPQRDRVLNLLKVAGKPTMCIGMTLGGEPLHPLMAAYGPARPVRWFDHVSGRVMIRPCD